MVAEVPPPTRRVWAKVLAAALAAAVLAGAGILLLRDRLVPRNWGEVVPGRIFRSGQISWHLIEPALARHGIRVVVGLEDYHADDPDHVAQKEVCERLGIEATRTHMKGDAVAPPDLYAEVLDRLHRAARQGKPVLVHCAAGAQRTSAVVALYRLIFLGAEPARVKEEMERHGWDARNTPAFRDMLARDFEELGRRLVALGALDRPPDSRIARAMLDTLK